jgi:glycosyltransferase involved in cell wall biosynthesis
MDDLIILIPAYNELKSLSKIIKQLKNKKYKFIVANDCSTDNTLFFLKKEKVDYFSNKTQLGYEKNLLKGMSYIFNNFKNSRYILTMDADGEHRVEDVFEIYSFIKKKDLDVVIGERNSKNRFIERIISLIFKFCYGLKDPLSGFKIYKIKKIIKIAQKNKNNFFLVDLLIEGINKNYKIDNFKIATKKRVGPSRVGNFFKSNIKIITIIFYVIKKKIFNNF